MALKDNYPKMDLEEALKTFERLQQEGGDLGALYWHRISELIKNAESYRARALSAEMKLERIRALTVPGILSTGGELQ